MTAAFCFMLNPYLTNLQSNNTLETHVHGVGKETTYVQCTTEVSTHLCNLTQMSNDSNLCHLYIIALSTGTGPKVETQLKVNTHL